MCTLIFSPSCFVHDNMYVNFLVTCLMMLFCVLHNVQFVAVLISIFYDIAGKLQSIFLFPQWSCTVTRSTILLLLVSFLNLNGFNFMLQMTRSSNVHALAQRVVAINVLTWCQFQLSSSCSSPWNALVRETKGGGISGYEEQKQITFESSGECGYLCSGELL